MHELYDVAVVGGGPIGSFIAGNIAKKSYKVAIFEEHTEIGKPLKCAGLVSKRTCELLKLETQKTIKNKIKGAQIHSPYGNILTIGNDRIQALVIDREYLDKELSKYAISNGSEFFLNNKVLYTKKRENFIELKTSKNIVIKSKLLIGADGPCSKIRDAFSLSNPVEYLRGYGAELIDTDIDPGIVKIFVGKNVAPGFFAWVIPTNSRGTNARVGLCTGQNAKYPPVYYFKNLLKNNFFKEYFDRINIVDNIAGIIPLGFLKKTYDSNVMIVGDAAAQVKPTSGGGVFPGILCAKYCSNVAINALNNNNFNLKFLKKYQDLWTSAIGREINMGMRFRRLFTTLNDKQLDSYIKLFTDQKIIQTINSFGDIDYPSKLIKPLIKTRPSLIKLLPRILKLI